MTNEDIQRALDRLRENATYHGDEAEDWTVDGDAETIRTFLKQAMVAQEMAEALKYIIRRYWEEHEILDVDRFNELDEVKMARQALAKWEEMRE